MSKFAKKLNVDREIKSTEVMVVDADGKNLGVQQIKDALKMADSFDLNLIEIVPQSSPPICKIMDYGKYLFNQKQQQKMSRKNNATIELKEIKFTPNIQKHDFDFKLKHIEQFISENKKVKCTMTFKGRELYHTDFSKEIFENVLSFLEEKIIVEQPIKLDQKKMTMIIAPK